MSIYIRCILFILAVLSVSAIFYYDLDSTDIKEFPGLLIDQCPLPNGQVEHNKLVKVPDNLLYRHKLSALQNIQSFQLSSGRLIPKLIFQTNKREEVPERMYEAMKSWMINNPEYQYFYFSDRDAEQFIKTNFDERTYSAYKMIHAGAYKADFFRLCVLLKYGGVYIDSSHITMPHLPSLDEIIHPSDSIVLVHDTPAKFLAKCNGIYNAFMAASPNHPVIQTILNDIIVRLYTCDYGSGSLDVTGPCGIGVTLGNLLGPEVVINYNTIYKRPNIFDGNLRMYKSRHVFKCEVTTVESENGKILWYCHYPGYSLDRLFYHGQGQAYAVLYHENKAFTCTK